VQQLECRLPSPLRAADRKHYRPEVASVDGAWSILGQTRTRRKAMDAGLMMVFISYGWENIDDDQVWDKESG
jgi:hypothetical protein